MSEKFSPEEFRFLAPIPLGALLLFLGGCGGVGGSSSEKGEAHPASTGPALSSSIDPFLAEAGVTELDLQGAYDPPVDQYNPDKRDVKPALGGRVIQHIASEPPNLNFAIENSAVVRWILREIHGSLLDFNMKTWTYDPLLAKSYDLEDTIILKGGRTKSNGNIVFGLVRDDGDAYVVTSGSANHPMEERRIPKGDVESVQLGTVFTFHLRDDVLWHDGNRFDAEDVLFSWQIYGNPGVDCDEKRSTFDDIVHGEILDPHTVRFFYAEQHFQAAKNFSLDLCILPSHLYNLKDPTNKDYNPNAPDSLAAKHINDNPHNIDWVGLGPYQLTTWETGRFLEAKKFDKFFNPDPAFAGYVDVMRWAHIADDNSAFQALLNGEVDIFDRVKSEDFFGGETKQPKFTEKFYKVIVYVGNLGYVGWNMYRPELSDVRVRTALAHAFDVKEWIRTNYKGRALPATSAMFWFGAGYDHTVDIIPFDVERAQALLGEAGWYDHDGNGIVDKDGTDLELEVLMPSGNKASEKLLQKVQESFERVGVRVVIQQMEWATFLERLLNRDFDACNLAWALTDPESDPFPLWHSSEAAMGLRTSNHSGLADAVIDDLIERGRRELDPEKRYPIWKELHGKIFDMQPYLFGWAVPKKIAFNKNLRGVKLYKFEPGYSMRDMYYEEGTPGTRPLDSRT